MAHRRGPAQRWRPEHHRPAGCCGQRLCGAGRIDRAAVLRQDFRPHRHHRTAPTGPHPADRGPDAHAGRQDRASPQRPAAGGARQAALLQRAFRPGTAPPGGGLHPLPQPRDHGAPQRRGRLCGHDQGHVLAGWRRHRQGRTDEGPRRGRGRSV